MAFQRSTSDESGDRSPADALAAAVRQAHEDAPNPAGIVALDGTLVWMNAAARTLAPVPDPGVTGQRVDALLTPDEAVLTRAILADLVAGTGDGRTFETRFRRTDGSNVWLLVDVWLVRDPEGAPAFVIFEAHDIDDRRRDQEAQADAGRRMRSAFDDAPTGIAVTTLDGAYVEVNGALAHVLGRSRSDLLRLRWQDVTHPDDLGVSTAFAEEAIVRGRGYSVEKRYLRPDGTTVWAQVHVSVVTDRAGRPSHLVANVHDVTRRRQIEASLRASEERFRFLASSSPLGILLVDSQAGCVYANDRFSDLTGVAPQHAKGDGWFAMVAADARAGVEERWREALVTRAEVDVEMPAADGVRWLRLRARPTRSLDDTLSYVATVEDVTEMVRATREAKDVRSLLQAIVESTTDLVALARADGRLVQVNAAGRRLMDIGSEDRLEDHMVFDFFTEDARRIIEEEVVPHLRLHDVWEGELTMRSLDGREIPMSHVAHVHRSPDGRAEWLSTIARDISERKAFEQFLAHQALHDPLTGLANRALFFDRITLATARLSRTDRPAAVLFLDLDRFKEINDTLGHGVGDWVLGVVAQRIRDAVRPADTVARLGGDEFGVLCEDLAGTEEAIAVAERLRELLTRPIELSDHQGVRGSVTPGASIGVAYLAPGADADAVTRDADAAMYHAKSQGRGRVEVFRPALRVRAGRRFAQEASLRRALEDGEIVPYYQPIVRADSGAVVGFEALARWRHQTRGIRLPDDFIPVAEDAGLVVDLGRQILRQACVDLPALRRLAGDAPEPPVVWVNVSPVELRRAHFLEAFTDVLAETGADPGSLGIEVHEPVLAALGPAVVTSLRALAAEGVRVAIDDFGAGGGRLMLLPQVPLHALKLDIDLVQPSADGGPSRVLAGAAVAAAHALGAVVVAEGIEKDTHRFAAESLGCDLLQGFLLGRPEPLPGGSGTA